MFGLKKLFGFGGKPDQQQQQQQDAGAAASVSSQPKRRDFSSEEDALAVVTVLTKKRGLLTSVGLGHNLQLRLSKFDVRFDAAGDIAEVDCDLGSLEVSSSVDAALLKRVGPVKPADQKEILQNTFGPSVLDVNHFPRAVFKPTSKKEDGGITGDLQLKDTTREVSCDALARGSACGRAVLKEQLLAHFLPPTEQSNVTWYRCKVHTPDFGIEPFAALGGMLALEPHVVIEAAVPTIPLEERKG